MGDEVTFRSSIEVSPDGERFAAGKDETEVDNREIVPNKVRDGVTGRIAPLGASFLLGAGKVTWSSLTFGAPADRIPTKGPVGPLFC